LEFSDEDAKALLEERLSNPNLPNLVSNGKVRILGYALRKMLVRNKPPVYFIGYFPKNAIYDFAWDIETALEACQALARRKKSVEPKEDIGFARINGESLLECFKSNGFDEWGIKPEAIYTVNYG